MSPATSSHNCVQATVNPTVVKLTSPVLRVLCVGLQGVCCQIMAVPPDVLQSQPQDESGNTWKYPPTALVYMARDEHTARGVGEMTKALAEQVGDARLYHHILNESMLNYSTLIDSALRSISRASRLSHSDQHHLLRCPS